MALPQNGQNANGLTKVTEIPKGKELIFIDPTTNEGGIITLEDLTTQILKNLTSQTFALDQGNMTLLAALNQLNSNSFPYRNITSLTDERNVQFRFSVVENITVGTKTIPVYTKGIIMAYTDAVMIGVFGAGDTSELYIGYRSQNTWMINCIK